MRQSKPLVATGDLAYALGRLTHNHPTPKINFTFTEYSINALDGSILLRLYFELIGL